MVRNGVKGIVGKWGCFKVSFWSCAVDTVKSILLLQFIITN